MMVNQVILCVILGYLLPLPLVLGQYEYREQYGNDQYSVYSDYIDEFEGEKSHIRFDESQKKLAEGDYCNHAQRGVQGVCLVASRCPEVVQDYQRRGIKPIICSYLANELVVCCPQQSSQQLPQQLPQQSPPPQSPQPSQRPPTSQLDNRESSVRKSEQKCKDYSKLATHTGTFTVLSVLTTVDKVKIPTCVYQTGLIVGGIVTKPGEFPHMAAIGWSDPDGTIHWNCGGSLISDSFVLTAAHCSSVRGTRPDMVRLGDQNLIRTDDRAQPQDFRISDVLSHPDYRHSSHYNDIALIRLDRRVTFTKFIRPACLWQNSYINSTKTIATGWGQVEFGGRQSDDLLKVALDIVSNEQCSPMYERSKKLANGIVNSQMCAGFLAGGKDTCQGDSGGPIQMITPANQCIFHIVGVTSFGRACAARNSAGVYTRVSSYLDWIESNVWP